ncbi:hypothetical protein AC578_2300 [Pseudocercospora eumusae]|uniref:Patatin-like phospholipase domain-containing protein n=1 Tax=Pseudocercospora eumusae TaxID=321146 RepID=A0A139H170_9PEZI|nr:hypothetical protein AC578_2300 [Pseudocercospora eumusae]
MHALKGNEEGNKIAWSGNTEREGMQANRPTFGFNKTFSAVQYEPSSAKSSLWPLRIAQDLLDSGHWARNNPSAGDDLTADTKAWILKVRLEGAKSAAEWQRAAEQLDLLEGNHCWKMEDDSEFLDIDLVKKRLENLKDANKRSNFDHMLLHIRESLQRDLGGMCNPRLYEHCYNGTKHIIEEYTEVVKYTIDRLIAHCEMKPECCHRYLEAIKDARDSFGTSALMLSGGGTLGMCHIGVVKALLEAKLLPRIVCGSSAGSIVGAVLCTNRKEALLNKLHDLCNGDLKVFQSDDEPQGLAGALANILRGEPAFRIENLARVMRELLGDVTFREAYNQTGMVLNIHVSSKDRHNLPRLLNYITSPNVVIWTAVASSCALPFVFVPPGLQAKDIETGEIRAWGDKDLNYIDGSIEGDLPSHILERLFNVNNFIASQVNPHVTPHIRPRGQRKVANFLHKVSGLGHAGAVKLLAGLVDMGIDYFPVKMAFSVLTQKYDGDITLLPAETFAENVGPLAVLANPTPQFMLEASRVGERQTWPHLCRIRNMVAIELALDAAIFQIQTQIVGTRKDSPIKYRRAISSTRSERGLSRMRTLSSSFIPPARRDRGRRGSHRFTRSMYEPLNIKSTLPTFTFNLGTAEPQHISSSDETTSGRSSPITSYDDDDLGDDKDDEEDNSGSATPHPDQRADEYIRAFLSQPASPSISYKRCLWESDNSTAGHTPPPERNLPGVTRALHGLQMTSLDAPSIDAKLSATKKRGTS